MQKVDPLSPSAKNMLLCSKAMWIGFGFKDDLSDATEKSMCDIQFSHLVDALIVVPEFLNSVKACTWGRIIQVQLFMCQDEYSAQN